MDAHRDAEPRLLGDLHDANLTNKNPSGIRADGKRKDTVNNDVDFKPRQQLTPAMQSCSL
jgi:hypothetical protein